MLILGGIVVILSAVLVYALISVIANISSKLSIIADYCEEQQARLEEKENKVYIEEL